MTEVHVSTTGRTTHPSGRVTRHVVGWCDCGWHGRTHRQPAAAWHEAIAHRWAIHHESRLTGPMTTLSGDHGG